MINHSLRHNRLSFQNNSKSTSLGINKSPYPNAELYYSLVDSIPVGSVNASIDTVNYITVPSSIKLTNGYINLDFLAFSNVCCLEFWVRLTQNESVLLDISNSFTLAYSKSLNKFIIQRVIYGTTTKENFDIPESLTLNQWYYISLVRVFDKLQLYVDLELVQELDFPYPIKSGVATLGNASFNGNFSNFIFSKTVKNNYIYKSKNLNALKAIYSNSIDNKKYKLIHVTHTDLIGNAAVLGSQTGGTTYDASKGYWAVFPSVYIPQDNLVANGLVIKALKNQRLNTNYSLDLTFKLSDLDNNVIIFSHWFSNGQQSFYFRYVKLTNQITFTYKNSSNVLDTLVIDTYDNNDWNNLVLQEKDGYIDIYYNGARKHHVLDNISYQFFLKYQININQNNVNTTTKVLLKEFVVFNAAQYDLDYIPYEQDTVKYTPNRVKENKLSHFYSNEFLYPGKPVPEFTVTGEFNPLVNTTYTYTITQPLLNRDVVYSLQLELFDYDDVVLADITLSHTSRTIVQGTVTTTFTIKVNNYNTNPYKDRFKLIVSNYAISKTYTFIINDSRGLNSSFITTFRSYKEGFLARNSTVSGTISNLANTANATTSAVLDSSSIYGKEYLITNTSQAISLPATLENIYTIFFVYRELTQVVNRSYVGNTTQYTFNGGDSGQLVGDLVFNGSASDYITAIENLNVLVPKVYINKANTTYVIVNESASSVTVYRKSVSGIWDSTGTQLNINVTEISNMDVHISHNGDFIALGFKNGYNGEGRIQLWKRIGTSFIKDLDMSTPIPVANLSAFGHKVRVANSGTRLFVSELGSNTVYIFDKTTIWSNTPTEAIIGTNKFGYDIDIDKDGTKLAITELDTTTTYLYELVSTTWTLTNTWNEGILVKLHSTDNKILISDYLTSTVNLYTKTASWALTKAFTSSNEDYGYQIDLIDNDDVLILDMAVSRVRLYDASDSYNLLVSFDGGLSIDENIYGFSASNSSVLFTNYDNIVRLVTNDGSSLPQRILNVRQSFSNVPLNTVLNDSTVQILVFTSNVPLSINRIGSSFINTSLNGVWLGTLFFDSVLTLSEIESMESFLVKYLKLDKYSLYFN